MKIGTFPPANNIIATPLFLRFGLVYIYIYIELFFLRAPNLLESKFDCPGCPDSKTLLSPLLLMIPEH